MTVEKDEAVEQVEEPSKEDRAAEAAAFEASFNEGNEQASAKKRVKEPKAEAPSAAPEPEKKEAEVPKEPVAAQPAPTPVPTPAPFDAQAAFQKLQDTVHGRIGDFNRQLQQTLKTKEAEGKAPTLTPVELKRMKTAFPELTEHLLPDIAEAIANIAPKATDPKDIDALVQERLTPMLTKEVAAQRDAIRLEIVTDMVTDVHPSWKADLWVGGELGKTPTPDQAAWLASMPKAEADAFSNSNSAPFVIRKLAQFYDWKNKAVQDAAAAAKAETEKQNRLKGAVQPQGVPRAGQPTMSDDDAEMKGFTEGFNS